ncbi:MAG: Rab family GTPase [Promethearchaeota archaeon]|jgi:small GTP-binding protein
MENLNPLLFRISILGDEGIGKDTFINTFTSNQFLKESDTGLGVAFYKGILMLDTKKGQQECVIWIWDLKEREGYKTLHSRYLKGTNGILIFFELTNRQSFNKLPNWIDIIRNSIDPDTPILLIGNREKSKNIKISPYEINKIIREYNLFYIETSLTTKEGIYDSFYCITSLTLRVEIDDKLFLSKDIIYYPQSAPKAMVPPSSLLSSQDLSNLSQTAIFKKIESLEKTYEKSTQIKIPLKLLLTEVVLAIGVLAFFITVHFLHYFSKTVAFPTPANVHKTVNVINSLIFIIIMMQITVTFPSIVRYIKQL